MILALLLLAANIKAPSNFVAVPTTNSVSLTWAFNGSGTGFQIDRQQSGSYARVAVVPIGGRSYVDNSVQASTQYSYRIRTYKNNQFSQYVYVTVTTLTPQPPQPDPPPTVPPTIVMLAGNPECIPHDRVPLSSLLSATVTTTGMRPGDTLQTLWSLQDGPAPVFINVPGGLTTEVVFDVAAPTGTYYFRFEAWITTLEGVILKTSTSGDMIPPAC